MKYYKICEPLSKKVYGTFPNFYLDENHSLLFQDSIFNKPLFLKNEVNIIVPKITQKRKSSKITDLLNSITAGFNSLIISKKLKEIFEKYKMFEISFFETEFKTLEGNVFEYYFVQPKEQALGAIDFKSSEFYEWENIGPMFKSKSKPLFFKNEKEFKYYNKNENPPYEILKLNINKKWEYDFFAIRMVEDNLLCYIVSEKLKIFLEQNDITGIAFLELSEKKLVKKIKDN